MKRIFCLGLVLIFVCLNAPSCKKEEEGPKVALKEEEEEFFKEELPSLEQWAEKEWKDKEWEEEKAPELETTEGLEDAMAATSLHMRRLDGAVKAKNWKQIDTSANRIEDLIAGRCVNLYYRKNPAGVPTDFILIGDRFRISVHALIMAGRKKDLAGVKTYYANVEQSCKDCHERYKKGQGT